MTDLFDRVAMRVLGSQANLRPRRRTRFEPMIGAQPSSSNEQPAPWDIAPIEDDPLAASAIIVEQARTTARRQTTEAAVFATDPDVRVPSASAPMAQLVEPTTDRHLATSEEERPPTKPDARRQPAIAASSSIRHAEEAPAPQASPTVSKKATAPTATVLPELNSDAVAGGSLPRSLHGDSDPPVERPVTMDRSASTVTIETVAAQAPTTVTSRAALASAPTSRLPHLENASEGPTRTDIPSASTSDAEPFSDPLGVRARARIEQRPSQATSRPYLAPPPSPAPVEVTIGRLEIRAESAPPAPRPNKPFEPHLDLAAYRARKERGA